MLPKRKHIRLHDDVYKSEQQYFSITIATNNRNKYFTNPETAILTVKLITDTYLTKQAILVAYCLMPDHLHLLIAPNKLSLVRVIQAWKSYSTKMIQKHLKISGSIWQRSFYDHALRKEEDLGKVANYILENPVRKELVKDWRDYPYSWCEWMEKE